MNNFKLFIRQWWLDHEVHLQIVNIHANYMSMVYENESVAHRLIYDVASNQYFIDIRLENRWSRHGLMADGLFSLIYNGQPLDYDYLNECYNDLTKINDSLFN